MAIGVERRGGKVKICSENACTSDLFASDATAGTLKIPL